MPVEDIELDYMERSSLHSIDGLTSKLEFGEVIPEHPAPCLKEEAGNTEAHWQQHRLWSKDSTSLDNVSPGAEESQWCRVLLEVNGAFMCGHTQRSHQADKTLHCSTVHNEQTNNTFIDALSASPLGSMMVMIGYLYPQHNLLWHPPPPVLYAPISKVIIMVPSWLGEESSFMLVPHAHVS
ncbi:uncharacterized protein BT62DRAFT_921547 [Guyanagaster necrorhizus]|uniref:Uncharacterized protein n=1 Tax=Guyanagaster necrorhizus TaxID=856835 RepID=A0A9P7VNB9_9AGAR|nr:uncharacterized protein BT62DRAFT_921547 [Guyanagaster necrorhizus MCA 3950]KAG7443889.1 hypothetical protein BT62DRAFT_921547 [Guyanagaster necrorhizus MCA 3950]